MSDGFRRDLELAPGAGFRLRRRVSARILSLLLAIAAVGWGAFDLAAGYRLVGAGTLALAIAFMLQLTQAELDSWRFQRAQAVHRTWRGERRIEARRIAGVQVEFVQGLARAWIELRDGEQVPLVEGNEAEVRRIAERLASVVRDPPEVLH